MEAASGRPASRGVYGRVVSSIAATALQRRRLAMNAAKLAEFWDRGFCCLEGVMESSELDPIRSVIERSVEARASKLQRNGHISTTHPAAPLEERWSLIAADAVAVGAPFRPGNWGQSQMLDKSIYDLLTDRRLTDIAATVVGQNVAAHGDYWIRPSTKVVAASGVPMHQDSSYYAEALPPERAAEMYRPFGAGVRAPESLIGGSERVIVSLWIPLVDVDESNGCLRFVAGSHRMGLLPFRQKVDSFGSAGSALEPTDPPESYGPIVPVPMVRPHLRSTHPVLCYTRACTAAYYPWLTP
eukprot:COSAG06_NODE_1222_length_10199_cov_2.033759_6_plen_299_part_00